ncbi:hypothetical protein TA3x_005432 [Tundrisphaera sp. TA3]|uniref:hypothetical protein n=1 Tax=Tundrisphaera sp. TA3 TaxID=3435775 RepID=UPI003EC0220A
MIERDVASDPATSSSSSLETATGSPAPIAATERARWEAGHELDWHRAETERVRVLVEFLSRPIHAYGGSEPDPDIISAYNLAVEAALQGIRRATADRPGA